MKKVVITGATGFVGKNLIPFLEENGFKCIALKVRYGQKIDLPNDVFAVIHLSGKAHDVDNKAKEDEYLKSNYELTKAIYDACRLNHVQKFIFISSVKAVADVVKGILDENHPYQPNTPYGISKMKAEQYISLNPMTEGKNFYILRPCMIHGPGNKGNLNLLFKLVSRGLPYPFTEFENKRSFLSIENFCFVICQILYENIPSGVYNLSDDLPLSTKEVVKIIGEVLNKKIVFLRIRKPIILVIAKLGNIFPLILDTDKLKKLTENYVVSNNKLITVLGKCLPVNSIDGLRKTILKF